MFENPNHWVAKTVDMREELLGDEMRVTRTPLPCSSVSAPAFDTVTYGRISCEICRLGTLGSWLARHSTRFGVTVQPFVQHCQSD